jgi:transketolase
MTLQTLSPYQSLFPSPRSCHRCGAQRPASATSVCRWGAAEIGAVLFGHALSHNPEPSALAEPRPFRAVGRPWFHVSLRVAAFFSGYDLSIDDIKAFRQLHSKTPGHPEFHHTPRSGMHHRSRSGKAWATRSAWRSPARWRRRVSIRAEHEVFDYRVVCLAGDGCLQEGVALEAVSFAGFQQLGNLILIYDSPTT